MFKRLLTDSISLVFQNLDAVFKVCGTWIAIQLILSFIVLFTVGAIDGTIDPSTLGPGAALLLLLNFTVAILAAASIAVAWHRFAMLGERPPALFARFGGLEARFLWKMVQLMLIAIVVVVPVIVVFSVVGGALPLPVAMSGLFAVLLFLVLPHLMRLNLVLPATALERPLGFQEAHRISKGLGWRMLWAVIVLSLPFSLAGLAIEYVLSLTGAGLPLILVQVKVMVLNVLLQILLTVLSLSVITAGYRIAMEKSVEPQIFD
ncbi:hypothetical protein [Roseibium sediminicola]|uniref:Glycerophosphoryl diester phosphodiesterase membrane domain-containing protein n=1 Tax=Roseibium sediminicola TaxID=2933272 RepID=A0ABT0GU22_9HYPH|nr:hypothetical protein [Roseibium sp. CAU 1639]MCK7612340.1 hypothetical protein [Roseibium sp. CAU 1639]